MDGRVGTADRVALAAALIVICLAGLAVMALPVAALYGLP